MAALILFFLWSALLCIAQPNPMPTPEPSSGPQPSVPGPQPAADPNTYIYDKVDLGLTIALIVIGVNWVIFGYRFMIRPRITLLQGGFIIFYFLTYQLLMRFTVTTGVLPQYLAYTLGGIAGLIGAVLFVLSIHVGRFFFSALLGVLFTTLLFAYTPLGTLALASEFQLAIIGGVGLVLGFISLWINKLVPIVGTSFNGAFLIGNGIDSLIVVILGEQGFKQSADLLVTIMQSPNFSTPNIAVDTSNWRIYVVLGGILVVTLFGVILQYKVTAAKVSPDNEDVDPNDERMRLLTASNY